MLLSVEAVAHLDAVTIVPLGGKPQIPKTGISTQFWTR